jgi:hypothetical protein
VRDWPPVAAQAPPCFGIGQARAEIGVVAKQLRTTATPRTAWTTMRRGAEGANPKPAGMLQVATRDDVRTRPELGHLEGRAARAALLAAT